MVVTKGQPRHTTWRPGTKANGLIFFDMTDVAGVPALYLRLLNCQRGRVCQDESIMSEVKNCQILLAFEYNVFYLVELRVPEEKYF